MNSFITSIETTNLPLTEPITRCIAVTPDAEKTIAYIARVSNPKNQYNSEFAGLIKYCIKNQHWSVFEHGFMTLEINTNRAIATQILRHRSFTFQQFSERYADASNLGQTIPLPELRTQDHKNRQNSIDNLPPQELAQWHAKIEHLFAQTTKLYQEMLAAGIAKECARFILPQSTPTRMYMTGNIRSWIHYIELRTANGTQKEHMDVANDCKRVFIETFPIVAQALEWI